MIKEIAEMKNCSKVLYFEGRKKKDLYITVADVDEGPTIRFNVEGLNTMGELKFSGNCLKVTFYGAKVELTVILGLSTTPRVRRALRL
jgi:ribosome biogenesis protein BRX1